MSRAGLLLVATTLLVLACGPAPPMQRVAAAALRPTTAGTQRPPARPPPPSPEPDEPAPDPPEPHDPLLDLPGIRLPTSKPGQEIVTLECGGYTIEQRDKPDDFGHVRVLGPRGRVAYDARPTKKGAAYEIAWCLDLDRDGTPELALSHHHDGGIHCCRRAVVLSLGKPVRTLLDVDVGGADIPAPQDLDAAGAYELVGSDEVLADLGSVSYVMTRFLPVVFSLDGGRYVRKTRRFPDWLRRERTDVLNELHACSGDEDCVRAAAEYLLGLSLLIGDWDAEKARFPLPPAILRRVESVRTGLERHLTAVER